ncbi:MAG: hypothetical protein IRY83_04350 [Chloroflexi bacterium]|nr:hypothetical protein [Chloroflexota bacterium]
MQQVTGVETLPLLELLEEAVAARPVREAGVGRYAFRHALVRQVVCNELGLARRVRLRQRVGEALGALRDRGMAIDPAELAHYFQDLAGNNRTPQLIREILTEILANKEKVEFKESLPSTSIGRQGKVPGGPYVIGHALSQRLGTSERLGSLAHELTHVSAGESYQNTTAFLLFDPTLDTDQIANLAEQRLGKVTELEELCRRDRTFSAEQRALILGKLSYARESKLWTYYNRFKESADRILKKYEGKRDEVMARDPSDPGRQEYERGLGFEQVAQKLKALYDRFRDNNSVLVEYDSVMNQVLLYLHLWQIPEQNQVLHQAERNRQRGFRGSTRGSREKHSADHPVRERADRPAERSVPHALQTVVPDGEALGSSSSPLRGV